MVSWGRGVRAAGYVIASLSFHPDGETLAIASGHKLFMWRYNERGTSGSPTLVLRCRHSLRAVHFHPGAQPVLLSAEVRTLSLSLSHSLRAVPFHPGAQPVLLSAEVRAPSAEAARNRGTISHRFEPTRGRTHTKRPYCTLACARAPPSHKPSCAVSHPAQALVRRATQHSRRGILSKSWERVTSPKEL